MMCRYEIIMSTDSDELPQLEVLLVRTMRRVYEINYSISFL
jgi:hypothetical protein